MFRVCLKCKQAKFVDDFHKAVGMTTGRSNTCKSCAAVVGRESRYRRVYGITEAEYQRLLAEQGGRCAICRTDRANPNRDARFAVDHNHETKAVRGLLCLRCNVLLANALEKTDVLLEAVAYYAPRCV